MMIMIIMQLRSALFRFVMQRVVVNPYRRFRTTLGPMFFYVLTPEGGTKRLSRNVGNDLSPQAA